MRKHPKIAAAAISAAALVGSFAGSGSAFAESSNSTASSPFHQVLRQTVAASQVNSRSTAVSSCGNDVVEAGNMIYAGQSIQVGQFTIGLAGLTLPNKEGGATALISVSYNGTTKYAKLGADSVSGAPLMFGDSMVNLSVSNISTGPNAAQQWANVQVEVLNNVQSSQTDPAARVGSSFTQESPFTVTFSQFVGIMDGGLFSSPLNEAVITVSYNGQTVSTAALGGASQFNDLVVTAGQGGMQSTVNVYVPYVSARINSTMPTAYVQVSSFSQAQCQ